MSKIPFAAVIWNLKLYLLKIQLFSSQEMRPEPLNQSGLRFISGIINKDKLLRFERMLFRATRGNMLFNQTPSDEEIMDPSTSEMVIMISYFLRQHIFFISMIIISYFSEMLITNWFCAYRWRKLYLWFSFLGSKQGQKY